jgi:hypothetical protein
LGYNIGKTIPNLTELTGHVWKGALNFDFQQDFHAQKSVYPYPFNPEPLKWEAPPQE